jgi:3-carboxy-cis,cis-muconate cycloisomerase
MFDGVLARGGVRATVSDAAWLQAMLDAEAALARARELPAPITAAIAGACRAELYDAAALAEEAAASGNPVVPLVHAVRAQVRGGAAEEVHKGATSQDILDTATMLVARAALAPLLEDLEGARDAAAWLAREHRETPMAARTLLQQALPTTFGLEAAGWAGALGGATARLRDIRPSAQLGGPAGTLDPLGTAVLARFAAELGLAEPALPWHTDRTRIGDLAGALGLACGAIAKAARDVTLHAQTEVGELRESRPGGSSAMAHKRNPVAAISALGCARQAPGLVASLLAAMEHEHQRAAGAWHAEWAPLRSLLLATGSAASWLRACLEGLEVDAGRMRANLELPGGVPAEARTPEALAAAVAAAAALVDRAVQPS